MARQHTEEYWATIWERKQEARDLARELGHVLITRAQSRIQVISPYNDQFVLGAHALGGRWKERSRCWSFPAHTSAQIAELANLIWHVYGLEHVPEWMRKEAANVSSTFGC